MLLTELIVLMSLLEMAEEDGILINTLISRILTLVVVVAKQDGEHLLTHLGQITLPMYLISLSLTLLIMDSFGLPNL